MGDENGIHPEMGMVDTGGSYESSLELIVKSLSSTMELSTVRWTRHPWIVLLPLGNRLTHTRYPPGCLVSDFVISSSAENHILGVVVASSEK